MTALVIAGAVVHAGKGHGAASGSSSVGWAVWLPAGVAFIAAALAFGAALLQLRHTRRTNEITRLQAQLNELYAPLMMWRQASQQLRTLLPAGPAWRLVDHIKDVKEGHDAQKREAVKAILGIWTEVDKLLTQKAGLTYGAPPPPSFGKALAHSAMLRMFWELGENQPLNNRLPFPSEEFDADINDAIVKIRARLVKLGALPEES